MRKEIGSIIIGIGLEVIFLILRLKIDTMPLTLAIIGWIFGGLLICYGLFCIRRPNKPEKVKPKPVPPPLDRSVKTKLSDGRTLTAQRPNIFFTTPETKYKIQTVNFETTDGRDKRIPTKGEPKALRFLAPHEFIFKEEEGFPSKNIPTRNGHIVVKKFIEDGFVIDEIGTSKEQVKVEVYT